MMSNKIYKKLRNLIFRIINPIGDSFNFSLTSRVDKSQILELIKSLHPKKSVNTLIRFGPNGDGGYLIPDDLDGIVACFSPGVDLESGFEYSLAEQGIKVFMADYSVEMPIINHSNFHFKKKYLSSRNDAQFMTLDSWVNEVLPNDDSSDLLLQMDIEGFEFECIFSMSPELLQRFRIIVIEFHEMYRLFDQTYFNVFKAALKKLLINHSVVHAHPNNVRPSVKIDRIELYPFMEFTFVRNDRVILDEFVSNFPHPLDWNNTSNESIHLSNSWHS